MWKIKVLEWLFRSYQDIQIPYRLSCWRHCMNYPHVCLIPSLLTRHVSWKPSEGMFKSSYANSADSLSADCPNKHGVCQELPGQLSCQYLQCAVKPKQAVNRVWKLRITSSASCDVTNRQMMNSNLISTWHGTEDNKSLTQWTKELWRKCTYESFLEIFHPQKPKNHSHIVPSPLLAHCCSRRTLASTPFCISTFLNGASRRLWPSKLPLHVTRFLSLSLARPDIYRHRLFHFSYDRG